MWGPVFPLFFGVGADSIRNTGQVNTGLILTPVSARLTDSFNTRFLGHLFAGIPSFKCIPHSKAHVYFSRFTVVYIWLAFNH